MRWEDERRSDNVEDRRGLPIPGGIAGGGIGLVVIVVLALIFGVDPRALLQNLPSQSSTPAPLRATRSFGGEGGPRQRPG